MPSVATGDWKQFQYIQIVWNNRVFFKFLSSWSFVKSRRRWLLDLMNISLTHLYSWSNESSWQNLAEKPANFAGCQLLYTTLNNKTRSLVLKFNQCEDTWRFIKLPSCIHVCILAFTTICVQPWSVNVFLRRFTFQTRQFPRQMYRLDQWNSFVWTTKLWMFVKGM